MGIDRRDSAVPAPERYLEGHYDVGFNILHIWCPHPVHLSDTASLEKFHEEFEMWLKIAGRSPFLLVSYENLTIRPDMVDAYVPVLKRALKRVLGIFRYGIRDSAHGQFTAVALRLGNMRLSAPTNVFETESAARAAIFKLAAKQR